YSCRLRERRRPPRGKLLTSFRRERVELGVGKVGRKSELRHALQLVGVYAFAFEVTSVLELQLNGHERIQIEICGELRSPEKVAQGDPMPAGQFGDPRRLPDRSTARFLEKWIGLCWR